jgi:hypothetical protein
MSSCFSVGRRRSRIQWRHRSGIAGNSSNRALCGMLRSKHPGRRRVLPSSCAQITFKQVRQLGRTLNTFESSDREYRIIFVAGTDQPSFFIRHFRAWSVSCLCHTHYAVRWRKASVHHVAAMFLWIYVTQKALLTWDKGSEIFMLWQNAKFWKIVWRSSQLHF